MRRAKKPPSPELALECSVFADMIAVGRRKEIVYSEELGMAWTRVDAPKSYDQGLLVLDADAICRILVEIAMAEYLRKFPKMRKMNNDPWIEMPFGESGECERDYQCMFCRKSLNTMPIYRQVSDKSEFIRKIRDHCEECGIRMLAGLMKPHKPLKYGEEGL